MSNPVPFRYRNPPDDVYAFNVDTSSYDPTSNIAHHYPVPSLYRNPPDDVYAFNVDTGSYNPTSNFALHYPVQEESLVFATDRTTTTYPSPDFAALVTASQSYWYKPVSTVSQSAFASDSLSLNPGTAAYLNQRWDSQPFSTGYITEHGEQEGSIQQSISQSHCFQSVNMDEVCQTTDNV
jgi:hypothetical protein